MAATTKHGRTGTTRRGFLKSVGVTAAGMSAARAVSAKSARETLAMEGGPKAVTVPDKGSSRWPRYGKEEEEAVLAVIRNPGYSQIDALEKDWKDYFKAPYVKAHCNGTSALASMFFALNLPPGSEIMVPSYTFFATIVPMRLFGLVPVFVDINPRTLNFDLQDAKRRLTKNTKAVLPVHWIGLPCEMDHICDWAQEKGLIVLEDAAHAHGAKLKGKYVGLWSEMSIFSYQATKPLPAIEGGMGMYQTQEYYERATTFGHYKGPETFPDDSPYKQYGVTGLGLKFRMHPVAAALARCQLRGLAQRNSEGSAQVRSLNHRIRDLPGLYEPQARPDMERLYYAWNMLFINEKEAGFSRAALVKALRAEGVDAEEVNYPHQHKQPIYRESQWWHHLPEIPDLPGTEEVGRTAVGLPYFTEPVPELIDQYVQAFKKVWGHRTALAKLS